MKKGYPILPAILFIFFISCSGPDKQADPDPPSTPFLSYSVLGTFPHDTSYFTEGIEFYNNTIVESTGLYEKSKLVQYEPASGKILKQVSLEPKFFGEGITVLHDTLYQLTYKENVVNVYHVKDFKKTGQFPFEGEGWGMTNDGKNLIVSNGSSNLYYFNPSGFKKIKELAITDNGGMVPNINELEYVDGFIYANQWQYNYLLKIDPNTGNVVAKLDLSDLVTKVRSDGVSEVLNGIAYNPANKKFYITGKNWPKIFELQFNR